MSRVQSKITAKYVACLCRVKSLSTASLPSNLSIHSEYLCLNSIALVFAKLSCFVIHSRRDPFSLVVQTIPKKYHCAMSQEFRSTL